MSWLQLGVLSEQRRCSGKAEVVRHAAQRGGSESWNLPGAARPCLCVPGQPPAGPRGSARRG